MQEKEQKKSPIKQRILQFADSLNISKRDFYKKIGVSRGTLEATTGITEDIMAKFIAAYPDVSVDWLILGIGEPMKKEPVNAPNKMVFADREELMRIIRIQAETLLEQQRFISEHFGQEGSRRISPPRVFPDSPDKEGDMKK